MRGAIEYDQMMHFPSMPGRRALSVGFHFALVLASAAFAGPNLAEPALLVNDAKPGQVDLRSNGLLVHVCDGGFGGAVKVDLRRLSDGEKFRISMDPRVRTPGGVVMQQLPPGQYVATRLFLGDRDPVLFKSDTFAIRAGGITSFGKVKVAPVTNLLGLMTSLEIKTDSVDIGMRLKIVREFGIDSLPVDRKPIAWSVEPEEIKAGKRISP